MLHQDRVTVRMKLRWLFLIVTLSGSLLSETTVAGASSWGTGVSSNSAGEAAATGLPGAPSVSAACSTLVLGSIVITWGAITRASTYTVYESTTSATTGFSVVASGVTATTYTKSGLLGSYWFEVAAVTGTNWQGPNSLATAKRTITVILCT
jgi:hypothetical protein